MHKSNEEDMQDAIQQSASNNPTNDIGISEFYIAKRAARKMIEWYYIERKQKREADEQLKVDINFQQQI